METKLKIAIALLVIVVVILLIVLLLIFLPADDASSTNVTTSGIPPGQFSKGVAYDPGQLSSADHDDPAKRRQCILADFRAMKAAGYDIVRTYTPSYSGSCDGTDYASVCAEIGGIQVLIGVQTDQWDSRKECIFDQVRRHKSFVFGLIIGNEDVQDGNWHIATDILNAAAEFRTTLQAFTPLPFVGTAQRAGFSICAFTADPCTEACDAECLDAYAALERHLDFIGSNVYPGSPAGGPPIASSDATFNTTSVLSQFNSIAPALKSKFLVTETGMPHMGSCKDNNGVIQVYSRELQTALLKDIETWRQQSEHNTAVCVFQGFDLPNAIDIEGCDSLPDAGGSGEKFFGVLENQLCARESIDLVNLSS